MIDEKLLKSEERAVYALRRLYKSYGYLPFKMSKFEQYELYLRNKDFLISDRIITFNDTNGTLMALKPDVTLSIIKNGEDAPGCKQKVYYNENVYRVSHSSHQYKEIMQAGLECIGDIDSYDIFEVLSLAAKSLELIGEDYVLELSHLGVLMALLDEISPDEQLRLEISGCIAGKNAHDLRQLCQSHGISAEKTDKICAFTGIYGDMDSVLRKLQPLCLSPEARSAFEELVELSGLLQNAGLGDRLRFDFSIVNDMNYYNGIVFKGFISGICEGVLSGGQYDRLMEKMGRSCGAVGFAIYLDLLESLKTTAREYDVDVLLLYNEGCDTAKLADRVASLRQQGKSVSAQKAVPDRLRYRQLVDMTKEELC